MSDSREAFEKWAKWRGYNTKWYITQYDDPRVEYAYQAWKAAQAQASKPIAVVTGWYDGRCVIEPLDRALAIPVGMALYSQPQAQAGDGEAVYAYRRKGLDYFCTCDESRYLELSEKSSFEVAIFYTAPPAEVNQQLLEALQVCEDRLSFLLNDRAPTYATEQVIIKARAAIAAAQEQSSRPAKGEK